MEAPKVAAVVWVENVNIMLIFNLGFVYDVHPSSLLCITGVSSSEDSTGHLIENTDVQTLIVLGKLTTVSV